jgi:hypothetical protein
MIFGVCSLEPSHLIFWQPTFLTWTTSYYRLRSCVTISFLLWYVTSAPLLLTENMCILQIIKMALILDEQTLLCNSHYSQLLEFSDARCHY